MGNAVFVVDLTHRTETQRTVEVSQVKLSPNLNRQMRVKANALLNGSQHELTPQTRPSIAPRNSNPCDRWLVKRNPRRNNSSTRSKRLIIIPRHEVKAGKVLPINILVQTSLLNNEDVHTQRQNRIQLARRQIMKVLERPGGH